MRLTRIVLDAIVTANDAERLDTWREGVARIGCDGHACQGAVAVVFMEEVQPNLFCAARVGGNGECRREGGGEAE